MHGKIFMLTTKEEPRVDELEIALITGADAVEKEDPWQFARSVTWLIQYYGLSFDCWEGDFPVIDTRKLMSAIETKRWEKIQEAIEALKENNIWKAQVILTPDLYFVVDGRIYNEFELPDEVDFTYPTIRISGSYDYHR